MGFIPAVLLVAYLAINESTSEQAKREAARIVATCRGIGPTSLAPDLRLSFSQAVEKAYLNGDGSEEMVRWRKAFPPTPISLAVVACVAASAQATAQQALENLLPAIVETGNLYPPDQTIHRENLTSLC